MTQTHKVLLLCLVLACSYFSYAVWELKTELSGVYKVQDKYIFGPKDAPITIVSFNKYACKECQKLHPIIKEAVERDGNVRVIYRLVTFGKTWYETLAAAVYAAAEQAKFVELHDAIYNNWPVDDHKRLFLIAEKIGLDTDKLTRDMANPELRQRAREDQLYFEAWALGRTPALLMNEEAIFYPAKEVQTVEDMIEKFDRVR